MEKFEMIYKIQVPFRYKETEGKITKVEYTQSYFANRVANLLIEFMKSNNATRSKYGFYETDDPSVAKQFKEIDLKNSLEQTLFKKLLTAQKKKDKTKEIKIKLRQKYLKENYETKIKPKLRVVKVVETYAK